MIKVLRIINRFNLGGPTYNATYLTAYMSEEFETKLIGGRQEDGEGASNFIPQKHGVSFEIVEEMQREISFSVDKKALKKVRQIIRDFKPDVVHTHASKAGFLGRVAAHKESVPVIVHTFHGHVFHSYFGKLKTMTFKTIERYLARKSDRIIAISEIQKNELSQVHKIAPRSKIEVVPLGFDLDRFQVDRESRRFDFRNNYGLKNEVVIGIIGRLTAIKNHHLLFEAILKIYKELKEPIRLFVIGDGELMDDLKKYAAEVEAQIGEQIFVFTSWIKEIEKALPGLDLVCLSSLNEGTPVSLIEAQAAGIPVISTNVGGVGNVIEHDKTGVIVNSFEPSEYGKAVLSLVNNKEKRLKLSQNGWNHVKDKFHYLRLCKDMEELYRKVLKEKGKIA